MTEMDRGRGGRRRRRLAAALVAAAATLPAPAAHAGVEKYFHGSMNPGSVAVGAQHSMTSNRVGNVYGVGTSVAAGAARGGSMYGNWIFGTAYACHPYSGANLLSPLLYNSHGNSQTMFGHDYFGSDRYC